MNDSQSKPSKILVIRADRIGDVVLSTPVFEAIKKEFPQSHVSVLVAAAVAPLLEGNPFIDRVLVLKDESVWQLAKRLKKENFDIAIALQSQRRIATALFLAQIPIRIGPWSKPHSYLFYNRGIRQHRSQVLKHEAQYNLDLLAPLSETEATFRYRLSPKIMVPSPAKKWSASWLESRGIKKSRPLIVVHPGMGGSALNWPKQNYQELLQGLSRHSLDVVVTFGPGEANLREEFEKSSTGANVIFYGGKEAGGIAELAALFDHAHVVVAPSTGPLHVAGALGKALVTFYPKIRVQSKERWGPYRPDAQDRIAVFEPEESNGCQSAEAMKQIPVKAVLERILEFSEKP